MISIIIPTLNEERYLPKLLESIRNQNFDGKYEIIIADANSLDKTREIAESFGCKVVKGGLPAKGRNEGARVARGEIFLFIDADVILPKDFLKNTLEEFLKRNLDCGGFLAYPQNKKIIYKAIFTVYNLWAKATEKIFPSGWMAILTKRDLHYKIKGFDEEVKIGEDHWYLKNASKFGRFGIIRSTRIFGSTRRFENDGIFLTCLKYIFAGLHMLFLGPIKSNIIRYEFNHYKNNRYKKAEKKYSYRAKRFNLCF
jgi:glycosyltransferase involved in cell wall biosynthesis